MSGSKVTERTFRVKAIAGVKKVDTWSKQRGCQGGWKPSGRGGVSVRDKGEAGEELRVQATRVIDILPKAYPGASGEFKPGVG